MGKYVQLFVRILYDTPLTPSEWGIQKAYAGKNLEFFSQSTF